MKGLCEMVGNIDKEVDRISELPEPILHDILSRLLTKDATKTCVLSKTWNSAWNSFPLLDFNHIDYFPFRKLEETAQDFFNYVNSSIARRRFHNTTIERFRFWSYCHGRVSTKSRLDLERWLHDIVDVGHLVLHCFGLKIKATFPLFRAKSLKELDLYGCKFNAAESGIDPNSIACFSLKKIRLDLVFIDDQTLQSLLSNTCTPSLEEVSILFCSGFRSLSLCSTKHRSVHVHLDTNEVQKITIEAPNLRFLKLVGHQCDYILTTSLHEVSKYNKNLKELVLSYVAIDDEVVRAIQELGVLEKLKLISCRVMGSIWISSYQPSNLNLAIQLKNKELVASCQDCCENDGISEHFERFEDGLYKLEIN